MKTHLRPLVASLGALLCISVFSWHSLRNESRVRELEQRLKSSEERLQAVQASLQMVEASLKPHVELLRNESVRR